ncbi:MAG: recombinase family protein [Patescibacteria group bacterium]|nr:recombinase family protein [Patescibacteria group bacterium]
MTKKALAYYRVSTDLQKEEGTIEVQKMKVREFAIKNEYLIIEEFSDDGFSGGLSDRPGLKNLLDLLSNTEAEYIVIYKLDRLARDLYIQEGLIKEFNKNNKQLISALEPDLDSSDPFRKAFRQMLGVFSEFERAMIALRLEGGRERKAKNGGWHGGKIYGYDNNEGNLVINQQEAKTIILIFSLRRKKKSLKNIAKTLAELNIPTKRGNEKWSPSTIKKILSNPIYKKGLISYNGERYQSSFEIILN